MTLHDFLDASYALIAEEHQRIDPLKDLSSLSSLITPSTKPPAVVQASVEAQNDASLRELQKMMMR